MESMPPPHEPSGWSRTRGIVAALVGIGIVAGALILSRLDLAAELDVVRGDLTEAQAEIAEQETELEQLDDDVSALQNDVETCGELATLSEQIRQAVQRLTDALARGGPDGPTTGPLIEVVELSADWQAAIENCRQAAGDEQE